MDELDKMKRDFIDRYDHTLSLVADEICQEIDSLIPDDLDLVQENAVSYCKFIKHRNYLPISKELHAKCESYLYHKRKLEENIMKL